MCSGSPIHSQLLFLWHFHNKQFLRQFKMSLTSISQGKLSNNFNAPSTINILPQMFILFLFFYALKKTNNSAKNMKIKWKTRASRLKFFNICFFFLNTFSRPKSIPIIRSFMPEIIFELFLQKHSTNVVIFSQNTRIRSWSLSIYGYFDD